MRLIHCGRVLAMAVLSAVVSLTTLACTDFDLGALKDIPQSCNAHEDCPEGMSCLPATLEGDTKVCVVVPEQEIETGPFPDDGFENAEGKPGISDPEGEEGATLPEGHEGATTADAGAEGTEGMPDADAGIEPDAGEPADAGPDADAGTHDPSDAIPAEIDLADVTWPEPLEDATLGTQQKFALAVYHFNIQYVAGAGEEVEDGIIKISFEPLLDLFLKHPTWGANFELQGLMIDIMGARHPEVLAKLKTLVDRRQIELTTFHYSDQFFLAFGPVSLERSLRLNDDALLRHGLRRSAAIFTQEGQFGVGMLPVAKRHGYTSVVLPKNLWRYQHGESRKPLYEKDGMYVVPAPGGFEGYPDIVAAWHFLDDGEKVATGGIPPSVIAGTPLPGFIINEKAIKDYENELLQLENDGFALVGVEHWVRHLLALGVTPEPLPPILDGDWQPDDTDNVLLWLGGRRTAWEKDNPVRTANVRSHHELLLAETLAAAVEAAGKSATGVWNEIWKGWKRQTFAEVTDASGWLPAPMEVEYGLTESEAALGHATAAIALAKERLGLIAAAIDTRAGTVAPADPKDVGLDEEMGPQAAVPVQLTFDLPPAWGATTTAFSRRAGQTWLQIGFQPQAGAEAGKDTVRVHFRRETGTIVSSHALTTGETYAYAQTEFAFAHFCLALPNGLIALRDGLFLIKDMRRVHLAGCYDTTSPDIFFQDATIQPEPQSWRFLIVEGTAAEALQAAEDLNYYPAGAR